ncbi:hypothetical protein GCM10010346_62410 [Streptomyces chryseus]|uniref:Secreted protein n=1 Tax=Streptomyces chryseus TaxID=68186 RepID=A0ABQ3EF75_9ACTN|nr:hypothetical protein GCM10010346_62410 [Streptomyces chryseus]
MDHAGLVVPLVVLALAVGGLGMRPALAGAQLGEAFLQPVLLADHLPQLAAAGAALDQGHGLVGCLATAGVAASSVARATRRRFKDGGRSWKVLHRPDHRSGNNR